MLRYRESIGFSEAYMILKEDYNEVIEMERNSISFKELGDFLERNKDNNEHLFVHPRTILMSWGCYTQNDVPKSCFVKDDPKNLGEDVGWY